MMMMMMVEKDKFPNHLVNHLQAPCAAAHQVLGAVAHQVLVPLTNIPGKTTHKYQTQAFLKRKTQMSNIDISGRINTNIYGASKTLL